VKWLGELATRATRYLDLLPMNLKKLVRSANSLSNPLFRFLEREVTVACSLLDTVRANVGDVKLMCEGKLQPLMELKMLAHIMYTGQVPKAWKRFTFLETLDVTPWISDFKKRLEQFETLITTSDWQKKGVWLGGVLFPEAFMTASRQYVAQNSKLSLDELDLRAALHEGGEVADDSFLVDGLTIEGGAWNSPSLTMSNDLSNAVKTVKFTWVKINPEDRHKLNDDQIYVPVYLNSTRKNLLFSVKLSCGTIPRNHLYKRGIALIAWNQ
jgi:dynein heavy chain 1